MLRLTSDLDQTSSKGMFRAYRLYKVQEYCLEWIPDDSRLEIILIGTGIVELVGLETGFMLIGAVFKELQVFQSQIMLSGMDSGRFTT